MKSFYLYFFFISLIFGVSRTKNVFFQFFSRKNSSIMKLFLSNRSFRLQPHIQEKISLNWKNRSHSSQRKIKHGWKHLETLPRFSKQYMTSLIILKPKKLSIQVQIQTEISQSTSLNHAVTFWRPNILGLLLPITRKIHGYQSTISYIKHYILLVHSPVKRPAGKLWSVNWKPPRHGWMDLVSMFKNNKV